MLYIKGQFRQLKITGYIPDLLLAGGHLATIKLLEELQDRGHDTVLITASNKYKIQTSIPIIFVRDPHESSAICRKRDITITTGGKHRKHFHNSKYVAYIHSMDAMHKWNEVVANASMLVVNSKWMQSQVERSSLIVYPKTTAYENVSGREYITIVNLNKFKGPGIFYRMARLLPGHKFLGVKGGWGEQEIPKKMPSNIEIIEPTSDMNNDVYKRTRVMLLPSPTETWGMVALEAMSAGIPVIAARSLGGLEIVGDIGGCMDSKPEIWADEIVRLDDERYYKKRSKEMYDKYKKITENNQIELLEKELYKQLSIYPMPDCEIPDTWWEKIIAIQKNPLLCLMMAGEKTYGSIEDTAAVSGPIYLGRNSKIDHFAVVQGPVYIGNNSIVGSHAMVRGGSYIGDNVIVGSYADVKASVVHNNVNIGPASAIHDSYIEKDVFLGGVRVCSYRVDGTIAKVKDGDKIIATETNKLGVYFGEGCAVASGIYFNPGRRVEACSTISLMNLAE